MPAEKKSEYNYAIHNVVHAAHELAASATTKDGRRLQPTAVGEFQLYISNTLNNFSLDPVTGEPLDVSGRTLQEVFEFWVSTRDGYWLPKITSTPEEDVKAIWQSGNRTLEAQRYRSIREHVPSDAGAMAMWLEEKAKYQNGGDDGSKRTDDVRSNPATNPWHIAFRGDIAARDKKIDELCKLKGGPALCEGLAKAAKTPLHKPLGGTR